MQHIRYECKGGHDHGGCQFCEGGLFACTVCRGFEGSLPTDCPGVVMTEELQNVVYAGNADYRDGCGWIAPDGTGKSMGDTDVKVKQRSTADGTVPVQ